METGKNFFARKTFLILIIAFIIPIFVNATENRNIKIQLRIKNRNISDKVLDNLKLIINKKEVKITGIKKRERYIDKEEFLGRNFIISFMNFNKFNDALKKSISYFVTEILEKSDSLIIHTNANVYKMKVSGNKERIIHNISKVLKRDMEILSKKSSRVLRSINGKLSKIEKYFSIYASLSEASSSGSTYFQFFSEIISDIQFYRDEFVIPGKRKFGEINNFLGFMEGHRYWIFIQNGTTYPFMKRIRKIIRSVKSSLANITLLGDKSWKKVVDNKIREMLDILYLGASYPQKAMRTGFINTNTSFFSFMYNVTEVISTKSVNHQLSEILKAISEDTGGAHVETSDLEKGIESIRSHRDIFWDIFFKIDKMKEKNKLRLVAENSAKLIYRKRFKREELNKLLQYLSEPKISVSNLKFGKDIISFSIESFSLSKKGKFGLLKVIIHFYDKAGKEIFRKSNTLRASKKIINISTEFPTELSSVNKIKVSVIDLISNRFNAKEIVLKTISTQEDH